MEKDKESAICTMVFVELSRSPHHIARYIPPVRGPIGDPNHETRQCPTTPQGPPRDAIGPQIECDQGPDGRAQCALRRRVCALSENKKLPLAYVGTAFSRL